MKNINISVSVCSHCRNYQHQRGWGGYCKQLGVEVKGTWKSCPLAIPVFSSETKKTEFIKEITGNIPPACATTS